MSEPTPISIHFHLARPDPEDARQVMEWRNDSETRAVSFHRAEKTWPEFGEEYERFFADPSLDPLFAVVNGERAGFLFFRRRFGDPPSNRVVANISINVAPQQRGRGLGTAVLRAAIPLLRRRGVDEIWAEIRVENERSVRAFEAAGYELVDRVMKTVADTGEEVEIFRYRCILTSAEFGPQGRVMVIAEAGSNWRMGTPERDLEMACRLIDVAVEAGADAVKFQTFRPQAVYAQGAGESAYLAKAGIRRSIHEIFADLAMPYEMLERLAAHAASQEIAFMSTPFSSEDFAAVDPHVSCHKIASYEISHLRLIEAAAASGKPLVLSTGASTESDIEWAVDRFRSISSAPLCLLQCTARYPAPPESLNLGVIPWLKRRFGTAAGLSDHSRHPTHAATAAVALGASVIEKHYTLHNRLPGPDHSFALLPEELADMVSAIRDTEAMVAAGVKAVLPAERELARFARRGIQATRDIREGEILKEGTNIDILRPGQNPPGVHPRFLAEAEGRVATRSIAVGCGLQLGDWR